LSGYYRQKPSGTLAVVFAGTAPGTGFGQLNVSGAVTLAGTLRVSTSGGFAPPKSTPFQVLSYGSRAGTFSTFAGSPPYTATYHATSMDVTFH
jgi:hypothetical protein